MIHIVFQQADVEALRKSFSIDESLTGDILQIKDDFAVGPVADIYSEQAIEARREWWREVLREGDYDGLVDQGSIDDPKTVAELIERLNNDPSEVVWIWAAQNKHDVCGYYWLMSQLKEYQGRIYILYLNNLPFISEKGNLFYPDNLYQIPPKEFVKAKKLARPVTLSEFEVDPDEWSRLQLENGGVRILEGGKKLVSKDPGYYDEDLKKIITRDWQRAGKIIHQFLHKNKNATGDAYLLWRLKYLLSQGGYDVQGTIKGMKDFEVKLAAEEQATAGQEA
jgi:hypothetical protein